MFRSYKFLSLKIFIVLIICKCKIEYFKFVVKKSKRVVNCGSFKKYYLVV